MSKSALGRGLGELLDESAPSPSPAPPIPVGGEGAAPGGVATLLRGKKEEPRPAAPPAAGASLNPLVETRNLVRWSLAGADVCLVAAGGVIGWQNPFVRSPVWFLFSAGLVLFGAWLGCLAWQGPGGKRTPANERVIASNENTGLGSGRDS